MNKSKHERNIDAKTLRIIKEDQQKALAEFVQTGDKSTVPPGVLQRYHEERASCEATLTEIAEKEGRVMKNGGYEAEDRAMRIAEDLGHAALTPYESAKRVDEMYQATPLGKDVWERRQIVKDRIGELNAELAYYMGLTEPPLAVVSEEAAIRIWGKGMVEKALSTDDESRPEYIDIFPDGGRTTRQGSKRGYGNRATPEFIKKRCQPADS